MRKLILISKIFVIGILINGCKKTTVKLTGLSSLVVVDATVNLSSIKANFTDLSNKGTGQYYSQITTATAYGGNATYSVLANMQVPMTIVSTADTTDPVFTTNLKFNNGDVYTLFLAGKVGALDTLLIKESIPYYADSSCGVRFVNLCYNSKPISVSLSTTQSVNDFSSLGYKQYSPFKTYQALVETPSYTFQVRDAVSDSILVTYKLSTPYFHNVTLALIGMVGGVGTSSPQVIRINHY